MGPLDGRQHPHQYPPEVLAEAAALGPDPYPTRPSYGHYLRWVFQRVVDTAPDHVIRYCPGAPRAPPARLGAVLATVTGRSASSPWASRASPAPRSPRSPSRPRWAGASRPRCRTNGTRPWPLSSGRLRSKSPRSPWCWPG
ncbi:hypothetical protein GTY73_35110 [Streptomyces sp. SID8354]|nr:hypothetical protein [Streptomyces sp. SID8354]